SFLGSYIVVDGLIIDGSFTDIRIIGVNYESGSSHNKLLNTTIQNTGCHGSGGNGTFYEILHNKFIGPPRGPNGQCYSDPRISLHAMYIEGFEDSLIDSNEVVRWTTGYSIHQYCASGSNRANRNIYSNNYIHFSGSAILLGCGQNNQAFGNV